jgi:hypothetical protein
MNAVDDVRKLLAVVIEEGLSMPPGMESATFVDVVASYNGIGPRWAPEWFRKALTKRLSWMQPAALVHDYGYGLIDADNPYADSQRMVEDDRFFDNCQILAARRWRWWHPLRLVAEVDSLIAWRMVRRLGVASLED